jgi:hypothetical protein
MSLISYSLLKSLINSKYNIFAFAVTSFILSLIILLPVTIEYIRSTIEQSYFLLSKEWIGYHEILSVLLPNEYSFLGRFTRVRMKEILHLDYFYNSSHYLPLFPIFLSLLLYIILKISGVKIIKKTKLEIITWFIMFLLFLF